MFWLNKTPKKKSASTKFRSRQPKSKDFNDETPHRPFEKIARQGQYRGWGSVHRYLLHKLNTLALEVAHLIVNFLLDYVPLSQLELEQYVVYAQALVVKAVKHSFHKHRFTGMKYLVHKFCGSPVRSEITMKQ